MFARISFRFTAAAVLCLSASSALADEALDAAFAALKTYQWGSDRGPLKAIDVALAASHADAATRTQLESRLIEALKTRPPQAAQDYLCRQLSQVGSAACVPAVAELLVDEKLSHMARYALERIPDPAAVAALREALPRLNGQLKIGVINSLAVRRDAESTAALIALLDDGDESLAGAAASAVGAIGNADAAKALEAFRKKAPQTLQLVAADAQLTCAERLLADGDKVRALGIYKSLAGGEQPKHIRLAATRGLLAVTQQK